MAGAACEALCVPFGIEPPIYRRRVDLLPGSWILRLRRHMKKQTSFASNIEIGKLRAR